MFWILLGDRRCKPSQPKLDLRPHTTSGRIRVHRVLHGTCAGEHSSTAVDASWLMLSVITDRLQNKVNWSNRAAEAGWPGEGFWNVVCLSVYLRITSKRLDYVLVTWIFIQVYPFLIFIPLKKSKWWLHQLSQCKSFSEASSLCLKFSRTENPILLTLSDPLTIYMDIKSPVYYSICKSFH